MRIRLADRSIRLVAQERSLSRRADTHLNVDPRSRLRWELYEIFFEIMRSGSGVFESRRRHHQRHSSRTIKAMHGRKKSDLPQTKEEKDAVQSKISNYKKASGPIAAEEQGTSKKVQLR